MSGRTDEGHDIRTTPWSSRLAAVFVGILLIGIPLGGSLPPWLAVGAIPVGIASILLARTRHGDRWDGVILWPMLAVLGAWTVSILGSALPAAALARSATMPLYSLLLPTVQIAAWSPVTLKIVGLGAILGVLGLSLDVVCSQLTGQALFMTSPGIVKDQIVGSQGNRNDFAAASVLMPLGLLCLPAGQRFRWLLVAGVASPTWILTASRQVLMGWVAAVMAGVMLDSPGRKTWSRLTLVAVLVVGGMLLLPAVRGRVMSTFDGELGNRPVLYAYALSLVPDAPITGIGPGIFGEYYVDGVTEEWRWNGRKLRSYGVPWVHSIPIEILVETGIVGLTTFGLVIGSAARSTMRSLRGRGPGRSLAVIVIASAASMAIMGLVDLTFLKDWCRCLLWTLLGLAFASDGSENSGNGRDQIEKA